MRRAISARNLWRRKPPFRCHAPRRRGIQYAAASAYPRAVSGILDHPPQCAIAHKAGGDSECEAKTTPLLHAQRDEPQFALAIRDQQQYGLLAVLLELVDALLDVGAARHRLLRHLDDDVTGREPLFGGIRTGIDIGDDHALDAVLDLVARTQILAQRREIKAERLLRHRLLRRR